MKCEFQIIRMRDPARVKLNGIIPEDRCELQINFIENYVICVFLKEIEIEIVTRVNGVAGNQCTLRNYKSNSLRFLRSR